METACFSETLASTEESKRHQNLEEEHNQVKKRTAVDVSSSGYWCRVELQVDTNVISCPKCYKNIQY